MILLRLLVLGHLQFFSAFFVTKYFDYTYFVAFGLLILAVLQALSLWTNLWQPLMTKFRHELAAIYVICLYVLSLSSTEMPALVICLAVLFAFSFVQSEIIRLFKATRGPIGRLYAAELVGGIFGCFSWYFASVHLGFDGFVLIGLATISIVLLEEKPTLRLVPALVVAAVTFPLLKSPEPLVNKRNRSELVRHGSLHEKRWEPNGIVELVEINQDVRFLLFDGGDLRSHILHLKETFDELKIKYLNSIPVGVWGLDVVLPHFIHGKSSPKVALISAVGGQEILAARAFGASKIDVIDINRSAQSIMTGSQSDFSGQIYSGLNIENDDGRRFIERNNKKYDVIQIYSSDSAAFSSAFGSFFRPSSLITVEALRSYDQNLEPDGILQITSAPLEKLVSTFRMALEHDGVSLGDRLIVFHKGGDLISFAYKKNGWTVEERNKILNWLKRDSQSRWTFVDLAKVAPAQSTFDLSTRPSTDNWPFVKINEFDAFIERILYIVIAVAALCLLYRQTAEWRPVRADLVRGSFLMGASYTMAQGFSVLMFQKLLGVPALGLSVAIACVLFVSAVSALVANSPTVVSLNENLSRLSAGLALALTPAYLLSKQWSLIIGALLVFIQGVHFVRILSRSIDQINFILWTNGLGCMVGLFIFNLTFSIFGLWQAVAVLSAVYLYISIRERNSFSFAG